MKQLKDFIFEGANDRTEYIWVDEENAIVYISTGRTGADASSVFTDFLEATANVNNCKCLYNSNGWGALESGTAAFITGHIFNNVEEARKFAEAYEQTCDFTKADAACDNWEWYLDGAAYVTDESKEGFAIAVSGVWGGFEIKAPQLNEIFSNMTKIK